MVQGDMFHNSNLLFLLTNSIYIQVSEIFYSLWSWNLHAQKEGSCIISGVWKLIANKANISNIQNRKNKFFMHDLPHKQILTLHITCGFFRFCFAILEVNEEIWPRWVINARPVRSLIQFSLLTLASLHLDCFRIHDEIYSSLIKYCAIEKCRLDKKLWAFLENLTKHCLTRVLRVRTNRGGIVILVESFLPTRWKFLSASPVNMFL